MIRIAALLALALVFGALPAQSQYSARITWVASTTAAANPSLTYNVYRAATCPGHFTAINAAPVAGTSFVDLAVAIGASYCYQVTAVLSGVESLPSNQTTVAVPGLADRQATCSHAGALTAWLRCMASRPKKAPLANQTP
jgi:fibronectin type 3 domain-containing protein